MLAILMKTLPFFAVIGLGYVAGRTKFFTDEATAWLSKFVFYFALSAMLFRFSANLDLSTLWSSDFALAYLSACVVVYLLALAIALWRGGALDEAAMEAQCAVVGNTGFLGVPMLVMILGDHAAGPVLMTLAIDLIVFSSVITIIVTFKRGGAMGPKMIGTLGLGLLKNPMIVSMGAGLLWAASGMSVPLVLNDFLSILGPAATPCALFAIGASLASKTVERLGVAGWVSFCKLVLHPLAVAVAALWIFDVPTPAAGVMIAASSLPVAGNIYILAQHYGVAPQRVSASILISTALSIVSVTLVIAMLSAYGLV